MRCSSADGSGATSSPRSTPAAPHAGTEAQDTADIGARAELHGSAAIRVAAAQALQLARTHLDDVDHLDIYSCFPSAVQVAAREIGLRPDDPSRPLTVTGGLSFAGGPWNNYSSHAIATMVQVLRAAPGTRGLVTANGGYLTKHAVGIYSGEPSPSGFRRLDVQSEVDVLPTTPSLPVYEGPAVIESWTVAHDRGGAAERGFLSLRTSAGARTLASIRDADSLTCLENEDVSGWTVHVEGTGELAPFA